MNKISIFATPCAYMRHQDETIQCKETGINPFEQPFEYMKYKEIEIDFKETGINPFEQPFKYMKYGDKYFDGQKKKMIFFLNKSFIKDVLYSYSKE